MKRLFDIVVSAVVLLVLSWLFVMLGVIIKLTSSGPILFKQTRVGRSGDTFGMLKFRSMVANAEKIGGFSTQTNDPRITPVGRFLRKTSLDELPQLLNVLIGDMSLVGPRPEVPAQRANYTDEQWAARHRVRPGITGLAQVHGRSDLDAKSRMGRDLEYAGNPSLALDFWIIFKTVGLLAGRGSN